MERATGGQWQPVEGSEPGSSSTRFSSAHGRGGALQKTS
jgi:hypothetical protein